MTTLISLLLTVLVAPTLLDRSDLGNNCDSILTRRSISQESINNGLAQGVVYTDSISAVGIVDNHAAEYAACDEFGERFFRAGWLVSTTVSARDGLSVTENGVVRFTQGRSYDSETAEIRIQHKGDALHYYLNGTLVFTSKHWSLDSRELRAYYLGTIESPLIGMPRSSVRVLPKVSQLLSGRGWR